MWPLLLDLDKDECRKMLRKLELEAYSGIVSAFRAQGDLTKDKKKSLMDLCTYLGVSPERHKAEIRRAVNDEKLATIADQISGSSVASEWALEGRRLIPLMPRLVPQTAFTTIADNTATAIGAQNALLPSPAATTKLHLKVQEVADLANSEHLKPQSVTGQSPILDSASTIDSLNSKSTFANSNGDLQNIPPIKIGAPHEEKEHVQLPNASSSNVVMLTGNVDPTAFEKPGRRKRSASVDVQSAHSKDNAHLTVNLPVSKTSSPSANSRTVSIPIGGTPVQFTLTGTSQKSSSSNLQTNSSTPQKVILVSTSCSNLPSSILQRSVGVPIVKTVTTTSTTISLPHSQPYTKTTAVIVPVTSSGSIVTTANSVAALSSTTVGGVVPRFTVSASTSQTSMSKVTGRRVKQGILLPVVAQSSSPSASTSNSKTIQFKSGTKSSFHIKEGSGLKIIAQTVPVAAGAKVLTKSPGSSGGGPPIVVVTKTGSFTSGGGQNTRVVNVLSTQPGGKVITPTSLALSKSTGGGPTFVTVGQKGKPTTLVKVSPNMSLTPSGNKPNVIVVQKAHMLQHTQDGSTNVVAFSTNSTIQSTQKPNLPIMTNKSKQQGAIVKTISSSPPVILQERVFQLPDSSGSISSVNTDNSNNLKAEINEVKSTMLADLLQAAGILPTLAEEPFESDEQPLMPGGTQTADTTWVGNDSTLKPAQPTESAASPANKLSLLSTQSDQHAVIQLEDVISSSFVTEQTNSDNMLSSIKSSDAMTLISSQENESSESSNKQLTISGEKIVLENKTLDSQTDKLCSITNSCDFPGNESVVVIKSGGEKDTQESSDVKLDSIKKTESLASNVQRMELLNEDSKTDQAISDEPKVDENVTIEEAAEENVFTQETLVCEEVSFEDNAVQMEDMMVTIEDMASEVVETTEPQLLDQNATEQVQSLLEHPENEVSTTAAVSESKNLGVQSSGSSVFMVTDSVVETNSNNVHLVAVPLVDETDISEEGTVSLNNDQEEASCSSQSMGISSQDDLSAPLKRKRKPVTQVYSGGNMPHLSGWTRLAMGLLLKIMKFRGTKRIKGEAGASHWFLQPVTDEEAPGYSQIVKFPMDFSTIKKRLETQYYEDISDFHKDMILVKHNCELYNPPDHEARVDCDEVFSYYQQEYERLTEKWMKAHLSSPQRKKTKS